MAQPAVRVSVVQWTFAACIVVLILRAAQIQIKDGPRYVAAAQAQHTEKVSLPPQRGGIYDRNGVPLALTQESFHVGIAPNELRDLSDDAHTISASLVIPRRDIDRALKKKYAYFHGPFTSAQVQPLRDLRGIHLTSEFIRFYPNEEFARPVLGRPAEEGRPASGVERMYDSILAGTPGSAVVLRDDHGRRYESPARLDAFPVPGDDIYLTLDGSLQDIVERSLAEAIDRLDARRGDVVVLDPRNGEILAVASREKSGEPTPAAFTSVFEPGSTAKVFAAAALLTDRLVTPVDSVFGEHGKYRLGPRTINDDEPQAWMTLAKVIQVSSNIGIAKFASRLPPERQYEMLRDFGIGTPTGVEFPAESRGRLEHPNEWSGTTAASMAMGYEISVTPLQLAQAYAAVAYDGVMMRATLVKSIRGPDGSVRYQHTPEPVRRVIPAEVARLLRTMLRGVVYAGGTAATAALASDELAGKTGTARRAGPHGYIEGAHTASFASMFPASEPQLVMVVRLEDPRGSYAGITAAPVTRSVLEQVIAARTAALDRGRLRATNDAAPEAEIATDGGTVPYVASWPAKPAADAPSMRVVPDVVGLPLREAVHRLHERGLNVRLDGWGPVTATTPAGGTEVNPGSAVGVKAGVVVPRKAGR
ncbi:MAG TPA: penicillin-binding transpeptidase domain-containing protein [Gemmatimonadales bacterium]